MKSIITTLTFILAFSVTFAGACEDCGCSDTIEVNIIDFEATDIAYVHTVGGYGNADIIGGAFGEITEWAVKEGYLGPNIDAKVIGIGWDDPNTVPLEECRYDACVTVPAGTTGSGNVEIGNIPAGKYAVYSMRGEYAKIAEGIGSGWGALMGWMGTSEYTFDSRPALEIYKDTKEEYEAGIYVVDLCVAITEK